MERPAVLPAFLFYLSELFYLSKFEAKPFIAHSQYKIAQNKIVGTADIAEHPRPPVVVGPGNANT
jgi:hypothetical protein